MKPTFFRTFPAVLAAVTLLAPPAFAQQRERGRNRGEGQSEGRDRGSDGRANRQVEGRAVERAQPRAEAPRAEAPRAEAPRVEQRRDVAPRVESRRDVSPRYESRRDVAVPRREVIVPRTYSPRYDSRYSPRYYSPRYSARAYVPFWQVRTYYRPYAFRPRFSIGFNIFAGYPVPYTYTYPYPYSYGRPPASYYGGVVLEIEPQDAAVYVDGAYAGVVADFDGSRQPLTLTAGTHRIEVQDPDLAPLVFDVTVQPGQVIPYRGDLRPY